MNHEQPPEPAAADGGEDRIPGATTPRRDHGRSAGQPTGRWAKPLLVSMTALAAMAVLTLATIAQSPDAKAGASVPPATGTTVPAPTASSAAPPATTTSPPAASPSPSPTAQATPVRSAAASVRAAVDELPGTGDLAVAVTDLDGDASGAGTAYDTSDEDGNTYDTASIVKVDILAALLLQDQHAGTHLTSYQRALATAMIERSDNDAATALWDTIGRAPGLDAANDTLGLDGTAGGDGEMWGLTQTTAGDQLTLLRAVFGDGGSDGTALSAASRGYIQNLMDAVTSGQRWGVSAADSDDAGYALKNGWLQRTGTGLWDVNSIGEVTYGGHRLLIAVLSSGQPSEQDGIGLVEDAAVAVAKAVRT